MLRKLIFISVLIAYLPFFCQDNNRKLYLKGNATWALVSVLNVGLEKQLSEKITAQADVFISPWKSISGNHAQAYMGHLEGRYFFKKAFKHWYLGANIGLGFFDITKWNYLNTGRFQRGFAYMLGATVGYQFQWREQWNVDLYLGGGTSQGFYHGYDFSNPECLSRYEDSSKHWNRSGEWLPYRGGIMFSYQLK